MLNTIIAYGQIVVGIPLMLAYLVFFPINYVIEKFWGSENISEFYYMTKTAIEGFLSMVITYYIFELLHVNITVWLPIGLLIVSSLWRLVRNENFMILFVNIGIIAAYKLYPLIQKYIAQW